MANYSVGNIEIGITGKNSNALKSIDETIAKLKEFKTIDKDLKKTFESVNKLSNSFEKLSKTNIKPVETGLKDITSSASKAGSLISKLSSSFSIGKIYFLFNYFKRTFAATLNMLSSAVDFNETLNKFQVSMGDYYQKSLKFVNDITKAFNISTESIMDYMSTFKNMLSALGSLSEETSYELSETLTRMALDYASLFNVEVERSMQQFQAVLSGQIRSIRSVSGYDVSETSIYSIYQQLGGTKTMRQLTQLEKRLLRIIALQQQMEATGAVGDFAKTINYTANQLKQLQETFKEIKRWLSQYLMVALKPVVEYTLSFAIAIREVLKYLNEMAGYKYEESGAGGFFGEEASEIENANEALNEYKTNLLGFDKLNVLGDNGSAISDVGFLTNAILKYESKLTDVKNKANDIAKSMLEWLGYTYDTNGNLQKTGGALDNIIAGVGMLLASLGTFKLIEFLAPILQLQVLADKSLVILGSSDKVIASLGTTTLGVIGAIIAVLAILYTYSDDFRKSVNNLIKSIGEVLKPIIEVIFDLIKSLLPIVTSILDTLANMLSPIINDVGDIILSIADVLVSLKPLFSYIIDFVSNVLLNAIRAVLSLIEAIWSIVSGIVGVVSQGLVGAFQSLAAIIEGVTKGFSALLSGDERGFIEAFGVMADKLKKIWEGVWNNIKAIGIGVLNGIIQGFAKFVNGLSGMINGITSLLSDVYSWTGIPRIPEIPKWNPNPIELATGGVITEPTHALVGEYKGAKSNPEIVTPENLMREVFIESMLPIAQAIMSGNKEVVNAIEDMANRPIELNGRKVSENLYSHLENVAIRKGKTLFGT